jgi:hypothetical protein
MIIDFGKYNGVSVELVMLKEPSYVKCILDIQSVSLAQVKNDMLRLDDLKLSLRGFIA